MAQDLIQNARTIPEKLNSLEEKARAYASNAKSDNTRRAYKSDLQDFATWCRTMDLQPMPASIGTLAAYLVSKAEDLSIATLSRRLCAIREAHRYAGHKLETSDVAFRDIWRGIRRSKGKPPKAKSPIMTSQLREIIASIPENTLQGLRDRALILIGFAGALRRSELSCLHIEPTGIQKQAPRKSLIKTTHEGLIILLSHSKTDQEAGGQTIGIPKGSSPQTCPVRAYEAYVRASALPPGPLFRSINRHGHLSQKPLSDKAVALIIKRHVLKLAQNKGMTKEQAESWASNVSGHSLRSGLATSAAANDTPGHIIQKHLRHKRFETTVGYIRSGQIFTKNAASLAGL